MLLSKTQNQESENRVEYELKKLPPGGGLKSFNCGNIASGNNFIQESNINRSSSACNSNGPFTVFLEIDYRTFVTLGGTIEDAVAEISTVFNQASGYLQNINSTDGDCNFSLQFQLVELHINTEPDTYVDDQWELLQQFVNAPHQPGNQADLSQFIRWQDVNATWGGVSNGIGNLCGGVFNPIQNGGAPIYSNPLDMNGESVAILGNFELNLDLGISALYPELIMAHEMAHSLGARHTGANAFWSERQNTTCPGHKYALEIASCGAIDYTGCDLNISTEQPEAEPYSPVDGLFQRTVIRLCPTTIMSYCGLVQTGEVEANGNLINNPCNLIADPNANYTEETNQNNTNGDIIPINQNSPIHPLNIELICTHLSNCCDSWGQGGCVADVPPNPPNPDNVTCPISGIGLPDSDCDGIPDGCECDGWDLIVNDSGIMFTEQIVDPKCEDFTVSNPQLGWSCNDNNPCTFNDRLVGCACIGDFFPVDIEDIPNGTCPNNTGICEILRAAYDDGPNIVYAMGQYPASWTTDLAVNSFIAQPSLINGNLRLLGRKGNNNVHGMVYTLCCPIIGGTGRVYRLEIDAGFLAYYNDTQATIMVHGSEGPPEVNNPILAQCVSTNGYECLGVISNIQPEPINHPTNTDANGNVTFDNWANLPDVNLNTFNLTITPNQNTNFIYISFPIDDMPNSCTNQNPIETNVLGGGSLFINDIRVITQEPPIILSRITYGKNECDSDADEIPNDENEPNYEEIRDCEIYVCKGEDLILQALNLTEPPFSLPEANFNWDLINEDTNEPICPEDYDYFENTGSTLMIENFDESHEGTYRLTVWDINCDCTNSVDIKLILTEPGTLEIFYQLASTDECTVDVGGNQLPLEECEIYYCPEDYDGIYLLPALSSYISYFPEVYQCENSEGLDFAEWCIEVNQGGSLYVDIGGGQSSQAVGGYGTFLIQDKYCQDNFKLLNLVEDTPPPVDNFSFSSEINENCELEICIEYLGPYDLDRPVDFLFDFEDSMGETWVSAGLLEEPICFVLGYGLVNIEMRWSDPGSCCVFLGEFEHVHPLEPMVDIDHALCGNANGAIAITNEVAGYNYEWSNNSSDNPIVCLAPGIYSLTVTDNAGCTAVFSYEIENRQVDIINQFGGNTGLMTSSQIANEGIKLDAGQVLSWTFEPWRITDQVWFEIALDQNFLNPEVILNPLRVSGYPESCCNNSTCNCSDLFLGDIADGTNIDFENITVNPISNPNGPDKGVGEGIVRHANECNTNPSMDFTYNYLEGKLVIPYDGWVRIKMDPQACSSGNTGWRIIVSCDGNPIDPTNYPIGLEGLVENVNFAESEFSTKSNVLGSLDFEVYPNPANDLLYIESNDESLGNATIRLYNPSMQLVKKTTMNIQKVQVDISNLPSGVYLLRLEKNNRTKIVKVTKI